MQPQDFNDILAHQIKTCESMLMKKAEEYAADADRLHNFRQAAHLNQTTMAKALAGMMVKHTVSIYDMIETEEYYPVEVWSEKITDHLNYLLLLKAVVVEDEMMMTPTLPKEN